MVKRQEREREREERRKRRCCSVEVFNKESRR